MADRPDPAASPRDLLPPLVLASASPRRAGLLSMLGFSFSVHPAELPEEVGADETPEEHAERLAREKAEAIAADHPRALVVAGDTVVVEGGEILGKPSDPTRAREMLLRLQGRTHVVVSGVAVAAPGGRTESGTMRTEVTFRPFGGAVADAYVSTGEPLDKAGAYGIQGLGASLVTGIRGDYYTVVGLPVPLLLELLERTGWRYAFGRLERL